jgi:tellurite resistance protein
MALAVVFEEVRVNLSELEKHASQIREELQVPKQGDVYVKAVEAGYLVACADGTISDEERETMVQAIELLSQGTVIEWELETLLDDCAQRRTDAGAEARAEAVGRELKDLGGAEAGLLFAAFVAHASSGVDDQEAGVLHAIAKAAGVGKGKVTALLKRVGSKAT